MFVLVCPFDNERNELDTDMESSGINNGASVSLGFGGLGFGSSNSATKTDQTPSKGLFGSSMAPTPSLFGQAVNTTAQGPQQQQQVKSPFGGILKTATFQAATTSGGVAQPSTTTVAPATGGLFGAAASASASGSTTGGGGLFSSFKTPQKTGAPSVGFGAPPTFGSAANTFGSPPTFGAAPAFGASARKTNDFFVLFCVFGVIIQQRAFVFVF